MGFLDQMKQTATQNVEYNKSVTENGAIGYATSGKRLVDMNLKTSSYRNLSDNQIINDFEGVYLEHKELALKWLFFARDIRGGMGERRLFRVCLKWLVERHPQDVLHLLPLVSEYGRWDDLFVILDTKKANDVINIIGYQLEADIDKYNKGENVSLLAKWLPTPSTANVDKKRWAKKFMKAFKLDAKQYQKLLSTLRGRIGIVETKMSQGKWEQIDYTFVPSKANLKYNNAFLRHDEKRRRDFLKLVDSGKAKINSGTLFPHEIWSNLRRGGDDESLDALWDSQKRYESLGEMIVVCDGSGSMLTQIGKTKQLALDVAQSLATYFAEGLKGSFRGKFITFSMNPKLVDISGCYTLKDKFNMVSKHTEVANTDIYKVYKLILDTAMANKTPIEEMPKSVLIISDGEFDGMAYTGGGKHRGGTNSLFKELEAMFNDKGYPFPKTIFWNVMGRSGTIPMVQSNTGLALVSGFSPSITSMLLSNKNDPFEILLEKLLSERYSYITLK